MEPQTTLNDDVPEDTLFDDDVTSLLFDVVLPGVILYTDSEDPTSFWGFSEHKNTYALRQVSALGVPLPGTPQFEDHNMPMILVEEPDVNTPATRRFIEWLATWSGDE